MIPLELQPLVEYVALQHGADACVVLFGSHAMGEANEWSDYDVLVLAAFDPKRRRGVDIARRVKGLPLDLLCLTPAEFRERLFAAVEGKPAPPVEGRDTSLAESMVALSALDGVCLLGETQFEPFLELRRKWIEDGTLRDPRLDRYPCIRDGLVRCQCELLKFLPTGRFNKCAKVVSLAAQSSLSGDSQLYRMLLAMTQKFVTRYPLIEGQGNFGSVYGDSAAAMRYTECRTSKLTQFGESFRSCDHVSSDQLKAVVNRLNDLSGRDNVTVDDIQRAVTEAIDESRDSADESITLDGLRFPNLLANGTLQLPGVDAEFPPFWLGGIVSAMRTYIEDRKASDRTLVNAVGLPDFPLGGIIVNKEQTEAAILSGKGTIHLRGRCEAGMSKDGTGNAISIVELPCGVTVCDVLDDLKQAGKPPGVKKIEDQTTHSELRVELKLTRKANAAETLEAVTTLPTMNVRQPISMMVSMDDAIVSTNIPDLIRQQSERLLSAHNGKRKEARKELAAMTSLDSERRRTTTV